jgi:putative DNA primase/helicase
MTLTKEQIDEIKAALERAKGTPAEPPEPNAPADPPPIVEAAKPAARSRRDGAAKLICNESGKPISCLANAVSILRGFDPRWLGVLAYDQFSSAIVTRKSPPWGGTVGQWTSSDDVRAADYLNHVGIFVSSKVAAQAADIAARDSGFHPIREFLHSLKWDRTRRLDNWLSTYLGAEASAWTKAAGSRWLISGVARAMKPGCQADYLLLLVGPQGAMKSSALQILAGDGWFRDHISSITSKDSRIELQGKWLVELGELAAKRNSTHEAMKSFLTCRIDSFRPVYGTRVVDYPRQAIFSASTNSRDSLSDETGNRRYWPVSVGAINLEALRKDRAQLWAEAFARFQSGESWWLTTKELNALAEAEQDKNYSAGAYDDRILNWCSNPKGGGENMRSVRGKVIASEISELALGVGTAAPHFTRVQREIRTCLTHHRWTSRQERIPGTNQRARFWTSPDPE